MKPFLPPDLTPLSPELLLLGMTMVLLLLASLSKTDDTKPVMRLGIFTLVGVLVMLFNFCEECTTTFGGMFITDTFALFMKGLVVTGSAFSLLMAGQYMEQQKISRFEYPILVLFSTLGMMLMISANDLMALYVGLELQSLPLYVLASIRRDSLRATEAGLKYFVLGALSSGLLLYGASLIYGFAGATEFEQIANAVKMQTEVNLGLLVGMVLLISGMAFKISAVPFHMWVPDVYQGAPTSVTAFFAIAPKVAAMALLIRVLMGPFGEMAEDWRQIIALISVASMLLGAFAAIVQTNIKRLLAYSSIGHMGYALVGIAAGGAAGVQAVVFYMSIYMVMSIGAFAVVLMMQRKGEMAEEISDLAGLAAARPVLAAAMTVLMFSMAGIPPLAGFFGKLFIFQIAVAQGLYALAVIGVLSSVVAAYYYLRVIKIMYFDAPAKPLDVVKHAGLRVSLTLACLAVLFFVIAPTFLMDAAAVAAGAFVKDVTL